MKLRRIDYVTVFICAFAAALCGLGSPFSAPCFVLSSSIGLVDSMKNKVLSGALINGIFLTLNLFMTFKNFMSLEELIITNSEKVIQFLLERGIIMLKELI